MATETAQPILTMRGVSKTFGGVHALTDVDLTVAEGEVHALIGENGAGKSTLMKILSGALDADAGTMTLSGGPYTPKNPADARTRGIAMVYQELNLALHLTVEENLMLGIEKSRFGFIDAGAHRGAVESALNTLGHPGLTPDTRVSDLPPAARQLVEIARGLMTDARIFVMDEPTSSLSRADTECLFGVIRSLRASGVSIIYISHFLEEVEEIADRYTVLRDGCAVGSGALADTTMDSIIALMVGRELNEMFPRIPHEMSGERILVHGLAGEKQPREVTFNIARGEIFGIAGLVGAGRTETVRILYGLDEKHGGEVTIDGHGAPAGGATPRTAMNHGISYLSEDRKNEGLALSLSIAKNITLSNLKSYARLGFVPDKAVAAAANTWVEKLGIKTDSVTGPVSGLSGGNQQKAAIARLLEEDADIFLLDEPTRGVDVGSKVEIFKLIGELARAGKAVLIISSYLPELLGICDTIAVMHRGVLGPKYNARDVDEYQIMNEATSGTEKA